VNIASADPAIFNLAKYVMGRVRVAAQPGDTEIFQLHLPIRICDDGSHFFTHLSLLLLLDFYIIPWFFRVKYAKLPVIVQIWNYIQIC
jgi:hypothetical protein